MGCLGIFFLFIACGLVTSAGAAWITGSNVGAVACGIFALVFFALAQTAKPQPRSYRTTSRKPPRSTPRVEVAFGDEDPNWQREGESIAYFFTKVVGLNRPNSFDGSERMNALLHCSVGEQLYFVRVPRNEHSPGGRAILVARGNGSVLGYLMEFRAQQVAPVMDQGFQYLVTIEGLLAKDEAAFCNLRAEIVGRDNNVASRVKSETAAVRKRLASAGAGV